MVPASPGEFYSVQDGDSLFSIAQQAYGDGNQWEEIYEKNRGVIGNDPNLIIPGEVIFIPPKTCRVIAVSLDLREAPTSQSTLVLSYPSGTDVNYIKVVYGEFIEGNSFWGYSYPLELYFWMGGTDHPNG